MIKIKVNISATVPDYEGKPVMHQGKDLTWKTVIVDALNNLYSDEPQTAEDKNRCYQISVKCYTTNEPELTLDDRSFILRKIAKIWNPLVTGKAQEYFDKPESEAQQES